MRVWPGMNNHTRFKFPCPLPGELGLGGGSGDGEDAKERVAIEVGCAKEGSSKGKMEDGEGSDCVVMYEGVMRYPILRKSLDPLDG